MANIQVGILWSLKYVSSLTLVIQVGILSISSISFRIKVAHKQYSNLLMNKIHNIKYVCCDTLVPEFSTLLICLDGQNPKGNDTFKLNIQLPSNWNLGNFSQVLQ